MVRRDVLSRVSQGGRRALEEHGVVRTFERGEYVCFAGDPSDHLYLIRRGLLRVERSTVDGRVVLLELSGAGDLFGEMGALDGQPRSASASALEVVTALTVPASAIPAIAQDHPDVLMAITMSVVERMRDLTTQFVESTERSITARVAARLVALIDRTEFADETGGFTLAMPISQEELAQWTGLSREGLVKALRQLRQNGVLSTARRRIEVHRVDELRCLASRSH